MAPPDDGKERKDRPPRLARPKPPKGETLDDLLGAAGKACSERGRDDAARVIERARKGK